MAPVELDTIAKASRRYGADPQHVFGGGGNTSFKTADHLYVKPSGISLATIEPNEFVKMDRDAIRRVYEYASPEDPAEREALVKQVMASAVCPDSSGRPSVEAPLHELLPGAFVVHTHPILVNGMTCAVDGAATAERLFPEALWVDYTDPGYTLAVKIRDELESYTADRGKAPNTVILQNHGIFVCGDTIEEIDAAFDDIFERLQQAYSEAGVDAEVPDPKPDPDAIREFAPAVRSWLAADERRQVVHSHGHFEPVEGPLTPDHMVYSKSYPFIGEPSEEAVQAFRAKHSYAPVVLAIPGKAVMTTAPNLKSARLAMESARNAAAVVQLTKAFGGTRFLNQRERSFIENWEVESYRKKVAVGIGAVKRMLGRVMLVTGGAQGFGLGIARAMAAEGATVYLADLNEEGARAAAAELEEVYGAGAAVAVGVNVANEESVAAMAERILSITGGLDVLINNAGVLRAGSVKELSLRDWELVNAVNYTGYFLCVKHLSRIMAAQNVSGSPNWMDIVQINSKSGLEGSNRNGAYAGSKFGSIGLTQSFALELIDDCIKVNSICPGNFFDGPLWSDPEKGLFVQYLQSGKVPGAQTVADVRAAYEEKVPMKRGCLPEDVARAIMYTVEQQYETGQAIPVTGGQVMLK